MSFCENGSFIDTCLEYRECVCFEEKFSKITINCFGDDNYIDELQYLWKYPELPLVQDLNLMGCSSTSLNQNSFIGAKIQSLETDCPFNHIDEKSFEVIHNLERLTMINLELSTIPAAVENLTPLTHLTLTLGKLVQVGKELQKLVNLIHLSLMGNNIQIISRDAFINCRKIQHIDFDINNIKFFYPETFSRTKNIKEFYVSNNALQTTNGLPSRASLENLRILALENNNLTTLPRTIFSEISPYLALGGNPLVCDCRISWLRKLYVNEFLWYPKYLSLVCNKPENFRAKTLLELAEDDLTRWSIGCPPDCNCTCIDENENFSIKVDCSGRHLSKFPDIFPENVSQLHLQDNFLTNPVSLDFEVLSNLRMLNLERNSIRELDFVLPKNISTVLLSQNNIERFLINPPPSVTLWSLSGNPWICDCGTIEFRKWMLSHKNMIADVNSIRCHPDGSPEHLKGKAIFFLSEADLCTAYINIYVVITFSIMSFVILTLAAIILYNRYHYHVKVWLFSRGFTFLKKEVEHDQEKIHDAFISSAAEDIRIVEEFIIPELERKLPYYSLFEPRRDMRTDVPFKCEKEMEEILKSKRIIVLLSKNYVNNNFLMGIFKFAFAASLEEKMFRLIPIIVGDLPLQSNADLSLRTLVKSARCLRFQENMFREKLLFAMPKKQVPIYDCCWCSCC